MEAITKMSPLDRILLIAGLVCHLIGMPLAEWVDVRWFYLVLIGEGLWMIYARAKRE